MNDKLTPSFELHQDRHVRSHFQIKTCTIYKVQSQQAKQKKAYYGKSQRENH